jgi:5-methylcytosine-specific restriction endonuclease McrA
MKRNGTLERKKSHALSKIPIEYDDFIRQNVHLKDGEIAELLQKKGIDVSRHNVKYRRKKLGIKKYDGKHSLERAKRLAIEAYGNCCEICGYDTTIDFHHIIDKREKIDNSLSNLMILCPNCHALITRKIVTISSRLEIERLRSEIASITSNSNVYI